MDTGINPDTFAIDDAHLDIEWSRISYASFSMSALAATNRRTLEDLKREYDVKYAEADISVRRNPEVYGFQSKPTEGGIASVITVMDSIKEIQDKISEAKYQYDIASAAVNAIAAKKAALEGITELRKIHYYSVK